MADAARTIKAIKTATYKLHNPSKRKQALLNYALLHNHLAYSKALKVSQPLITSLVQEELRLRETEKALPAKERNGLKRKRKFEREAQLSKTITQAIKPLPICNASKAIRSIPGDIIGQVESHIELHDEQDSVGLPTVQQLSGINESYEDTLDALSKCLTLDDETRSRDELLRISKAGQLRPLLYAKSRVGDGFLFLKDLEREKYFVWLNLVPQTSRLAKFTEQELQSSSSRSVKNLVNMRTGEVCNFRSKTGCLFGLEFGRDYQAEEFIKSGSPLSAKLIKKDNRYEVHISFEFETKEIIPETYLGVDRGIYNLASLAVVTEEGSIVERKNVDGRDLRFVQKKFERLQRDLQKRGKPFTGKNRLHVADEAVHRTANEIVALAKSHRSQIYMENLRPMTSRGRKRSRSNFNRVLNRSQYQKLEKVLAYKMAVAGLPKALTVHAGYTSQACPVCGHVSSHNREKLPSGDGFKMDVFRCVECHYTDDSDLNAARNIALKKLWRDGLSPSLKATRYEEVPQKKSFSEFLRVLAEKRGESACDLRVGTFGRSDLDGQFEDGEVPPSGNAVEPRSGSNTPVRKSTSSKQMLARPSDKNSQVILTEKDAGPDG